MERVLTRISASHTRAVALLALLAVAAGSIWPTWPPLARTWHVMPEYSYSMLLVPFIACWIVARSASLPPPAERMSRLAVVLLLSSLAIWLVAYRAASAIGEQLLIPIALWAAVWTAYGLPIAARLAAPIACLYFAIPLWEFFVPGMQHMAVVVSETALGWLGVPTHIDGVLVSIPEGTFQIAEGCAGRRYLIVALTIAGLFAGTTGMRPWRALGFLCLTAILALITNWLRVLTVIYAGHLTDMHSYLVAHEHLSFGWALFAALMVVICLIGSRLAPAREAAPDTELQRSTQPNARELLLRPALLTTVLVLCIPGIGIIYAEKVGASTLDPAVDSSLSWPKSTGAWQGPRISDDYWRPMYPGASAELRANYDGPSGDVEVFVAQYEEARRGAKLISSANTLVPENWMVVRDGRLGQRPGDGRAGRAKAMWVESPGGETWLISYWYRVDRVVTTSPIAAQLAYGILSWKGPILSRIVAVATRCERPCAQKRMAQKDFWSAVGFPLLDEP